MSSRAATITTTLSIFAIINIPFFILIVFLAQFIIITLFIVMITP